MRTQTLTWLFTVGVLLHNAEEAVWLPGWSAQALARRRFGYQPVGAAEFRFATTAVSACLMLIAAAASTAPAGAPVNDVFAGFVGAMMINALVPHAALSIALRRYMPGTATAVLLNLPFGVLVLRDALSTQRIAAGHLLWTTPLVALALLASLPMLFALGRWLGRIAGRLARR